MKFLIIELYKVIKLNELLQRIVSLLFVFFYEVVVTKFYWGVNFIRDIIETRSKIIKIMMFSLTCSVVSHL